MACCMTAPTITLTNVDLSSVKCYGIYLSTTSQEMFNISITKMRLNMTHLNLQSHLPRTSWVKNYLTTSAAQRLINRTTTSAAWWPTPPHQQPHGIILGVAVTRPFMKQLVWQFDSIQLACGAHKLNRCYSDSTHYSHWISQLLPAVHRGTWHEKTDRWYCLQRCYAGLIPGLRPANERLRDGVTL